MAIEVLSGITRAESLKVITFLEYFGTFARHGEYNAAILYPFGFNIVVA